MDCRLFLPIEEPVVHKVVYLVPVLAHMDSVASLYLEIPLLEVARLEREVRKAQDVLPDVVETMPDVRERYSRRLGERAVDHAQTVEFVEHGHHESTVLGP